VVETERLAKNVVTTPFLVFVTVGREPGVISTFGLAPQEIVWLAANAGAEINASV